MRDVEEVDAAGLITLWLGDGAISVQSSLCRVAQAPQSLHEGVGAPASEIIHDSADRMSRRGGTEVDIGEPSAPIANRTVREIRADQHLPQSLDAEIEGARVGEFELPRFREPLLVFDTVLRSYSLDLTPQRALPLEAAEAPDFGLAVNVDARARR